MNLSNEIVFGIYEVSENVYDAKLIEDCEGKEVLAEVKAKLLTTKESMSYKLALGLKDYDALYDLIVKKLSCDKVKPSELTSDLVLSMGMEIVSRSNLSEASKKLFT